MPNSNASPLLPALDNFGSALKYLRRRAHISQRDLSIAAGYSESQISRFENNHRPPDLATLQARFVPALQLEAEPGTVARLLALAALARGEPSPAPRAGPAGSPAISYLPAPLTSFIGREQERTEIKRLLLAAEPGSGRLVTLTGAGGTGKTRLALQVGADLLTDLPASAWLVELAAVSQPAQVPQAVATMLALREVPGYPLARSVADYLRPRQALLVLDNCEHLVEACAGYAEALLRACPNLRILATSREALGFQGETVWPVPPLSLPLAGAPPAADSIGQSEAVRLFVERARAVRPSFELTPANAATVARICQQLDGLPLAIELAAARMRGMTPEQILQHLGDRFSLLSGGSRTALARHQTLSALIDWSYELLPAEEAALLRRLAVFRDGWTLEAAEAVCAGQALRPASILGLLMRLVDKSMVEIEEQGPVMRYRLLESIKQYAGRKAVDLGEVQALQASFYAYYLRLAEQAEPHLRTAAQVQWLDRLEAEHDNLDAALDWAIREAPDRPGAGLRLAAALGWFWYLRGSWSAARDRLEEALAHAGPVKPEHALARAQALNALGFLADCQGSEARAEAALEESLALCRQVGHPLSLAYALAYLGELYSWQPNSRPAVPLLREAIELLRGLGPEGAWCQAAALKFLSEAVFFQDDFDQAEALLRESTALFRQLGERWGLSNTLTSHAAVVLRRGNLPAAAALFREALDMQREMDYPFGWVHIFSRLRHAAYSAGRGDKDPARVSALMVESLALARGVGHRWGIAASLGQLAKAAEAQGLPERAARLLGAADAIRESSQTPIPPYPFQAHENDVAAVRASLNPGAFVTAWADGRAMTLEAAIAYALEGLSGSASTPRPPS